MNHLGMGAGVGGWRGLSSSSIYFFDIFFLLFFGRGGGCFCCIWKWQLSECSPWWGDTMYHIDLENKLYDV